MNEPIPAGPDGHRSTMLGLQFVSDMIAFMIANDVRERIIPGTDMPADLSRFPIKIVKYDKIIKVLKQFAEEPSDHAEFEVLEQTTDTVITVSFTVDRAKRQTIVRVIPHEKR